MISRACVQCSVCGTKTITRTALIDIPYQEFAFPCPGCAVEIRFGMEIHAPDWQYTKLVNAEWLDTNDGVLNVEVFDAEHLIPLPKNKDFSPFIATTGILQGGDLIHFYEHQGIRRSAIEDFWPQIDKLILHFKREQWDLFDRQHNELQDENEKFTSITQRKIVLYRALEQYSKFFRPANETPCKLIDDRIKLAKGASSSAIDDLINYFADKNKNVDIDNQIQDIRRRWAKIYYAVAPIYIALYWDPKQYKLADYTLAQKQFNELKSIYVDCFETFCRISVIAAGIEGIIATKTASVPKAKGTLTLEQFDTMKNGSKPDILRRLAIADLFVPFIDHRLRNGIGHHAAHYDVVGDKIDYTIENEKGIQAFDISYIAFCDKVVSLYGQLELVSLYSNWLQVFTPKASP